MIALVITLTSLGSLISGSITSLLITILGIDENSDSNFSNYWILISIEIVMVLFCLVLLKFVDFEKGAKSHDKNYLDVHDEDTVEDEIINENQTL